MADSQPDLPTIFLSHSGQDKPFVHSLYQVLLHVNHNPFFDQDTRPTSLSKGTHFPSRIFDACRSCKLAIVVLSHDYIESMWPMLELQQFLFHNDSAPNNIYPIFYKLKPTDLRSKENLDRWKRSWERRVPRWHESNRDWQREGSSNFTALTLDMDRWPDALQMLRHQNGEIFPENKDEHAFIQVIVSNICKRFPPPQPLLMEDHFKGAEHIQTEIHELFQKQQHGDHNVDEDSLRRPLAVGIYGVGGSGKTSVCKYMLNLYSREYLGNCCFIEFPSKEADRSLVTQSLKNFLSKLGNLPEGTLRRIQSVEEAMPHMKVMLRTYRVFLIIDNVWDWSLDIARTIVMMDFMPGSRLLVTARSQDWLQLLSSNSEDLIPEDGRNLPAMQIVPVPSIFEEEAIGALKAYGMSSLQYLSNVEGLQSLAKFCFFGEQCHPLLLKVVGAKLRSQGRQLRSAEDWARFLSDLQKRVRDGGEVEEQIARVLKTSYEELPSMKLQNTFLKLCTCVPIRFNPISLNSLSWLTEWLSKVSNDGHTVEEIRSQLMELKYHGLIQIHGEDVVIHDIQRMFIDNLVREQKGEPKCFFYGDEMSSLSAEEFVKFRYIYSDGEEKFHFDISCPQAMNGPRVEVLHLEYKYGINQFSVKHMQFLRHLHLQELDNLCEVGGWHGAPNLVSVKIISCRRLQKIESMTPLHRLESVVLESWGEYGIADLREFLGHPRKLHELNLSSCVRDSVLVEKILISTYTSLQSCKLGGSGIVSFPYFKSSSLRMLDLSWSTRLERMEGSVCGLTALEELNLECCENVESLPDLQQLVRLRRLMLLGCLKLAEVKLADAALTSLEQLTFSGACCFLTSTRSSPLPINAFANLRLLVAEDGRIGGHEVMDVGSVELPASLETLELHDFERAQEFTCSSALVNLTKLHLSRCPSLKSITGLGGLSKLAELNVRFCRSLKEVGHWEPPFDRYSLRSANFTLCPITSETLSNIAHLTSLKELTIDVRSDQKVFEGSMEFFRRKRSVVDLKFFRTTWERR